jgi:hypothetical protein
MTSEETFHAITKYVMGDRQEFDELKKRFEGMDDWSTSTAAALAYLIAKDELEAEKEEEEEEELDVYYEAIAVIEKYRHPFGNISAHTATDEIFTLIHEWLNKELIKVVYRDGAICIEDVNLLFQPFIIDEEPKA